MAQSFKKDPFFKVKVGVKYHPQKQLNKQNNQPVKRQLKQLNENVQKKEHLVRKKLVMPKNFYL